MPFFRSLSRNSHRGRPLPRGPDELMGLTETGKTLVGVAVAAATLGVLSWIALTLALA